MANPIWKDFYVNLGTAESVQFRILVGDDVIYTGKAFKRPGKANNEIRINDICADHIKGGVLQYGDGESFSQYPHFVFNVEILSNGVYSVVEQVEFYSDWSYHYEFDPQKQGLSFPINGRVQPNMLIPYSVLDAQELVVWNDTQREEYYQYPNEGDFGSMGVYLVDISRASVGDILLLSEFGVDDCRYQVVDSCSRYAFYYVNAYGGWDALLVEGNHTESDNLTRHTRETEYDNRSIQNRGVHNYVNEISKTMTLHTSWLSDDESSRMHHLLNSTNVYLRDLVTGQMIPVILTNSTTEYKTYKGNGGRLVNYTINVTIAQERIRR